MTLRRFAHVCLIVFDINKAIEDYRQILSTVDPQQVAEPIVFYEDFGVGEERLAFATFVSSNCEIQLMQPKTPGTPLYKRLQQLGEHVHHLCFTSSSVEEIVAELRATEIGIVRQGISNDPQLPWQRWTFIQPSKTHGVLIELANNYRSEEGRWEPGAGITSK